MSITISHLSKSFGKKSVLKNLSCSLPDKGIVLLLGKSGAGKTTLLRIISGLDKKYEGSIIGYSTENVSYAFQEHRLFPELSALENVALAFSDESSNEARNASANMLERLGISREEQSRLPSELSGGMRQRVSLARAFVRSSSVLILDEPFKELDSELVNTVSILVEELARNRLVLISTHEMPERGLCTADKILL